MTRRAKKADVIDMDNPETPLKRGHYRDPAYVKPIMLRIGKAYLQQLDYLCEVNNRSRREIFEMLIHGAYYDLKENPAERITPL